MKQINFLLLKATFMLVLMSSMHAHSQILTTRCGEDFHGFGHAHQNCEDDIVVTSTYDEGTIGTVLSGIIHSENGSIRIIPGYSKVKLIPEYNNGQEHSAEAHRTNAGNGGTGGNNGGLGRPTNQNELVFSTINISPNPTKSVVSFSSSTSKITKYSIYNIFGINIKEETIAPTTSYSYNLRHLKEGAYLLKIQLENGEQITKTVIKN